MFEGKEEALEHQESVVEAYHEAFGEDHAFQCSPVLDGAKVKVSGLDPEEVAEAFDAAGFSTQMIGEGPDGDWFEMKAKP